MRCVDKNYLPKPYLFKRRFSIIVTDSSRNTEEEEERLWQWQDQICEKSGKKTCYKCKKNNIRCVYESMEERKKKMDFQKTFQNACKATG